MKEDIPPYLVMDTCCFSNYYKTEEKRESVKGLIHFDYDALKEGSGDGSPIRFISY